MSSAIIVSGVTLYRYGMYIAAATLFTLGVMGVLGYMNRLPAGTVRVFGLLAMALGLLTSRAAFCVINWEVYAETFRNPWLTLNILDGGLSMTGLICGLVLAAFITSRVMKARFGRLMDAMCVSLGAFMAIARLGERYTELGVGKAVENAAFARMFPWLFLESKMGVLVEYRMPVYAYEAVAGALMFLCMLILFIKLRDKLRVGDLSLFFFAMYGSSQILFESLRDDGHMMVIFLRMAQVGAACLPLIVIGVLTARYIHLQGRLGGRVLLTWLLSLICVGGLTLMEFSLDGRVTWGAPSMLRDYAIMAGLCAVLLIMPCTLIYTLNKRLYHRERFRVNIPAKSR